MESNTLTAAFGMDPSAYLFNNALAAGRSHKLKTLFSRRQSHLIDLNCLPPQMKNQRYTGRQEVALDDIRGTEGRQGDFDDRFNPLSDRTRQRWQSVARACEMGVDLPPVDLIQVGQVYFVRDGHHRISVARALGQTTITAEVTVWNA